MRVRRVLEALDDRRPGSRSAGRPRDHSRNRGLRTSRTPRFGVERRDPVRAGGGQRRPCVERRPGRHGEGRGERELVQEVGVGSGEVEGDGVRARRRSRSPRGRTASSVRRQRCAPTMLGVVAAGAVGRQASARSIAAAEVLRPHERAGRVADARAQPERVRPAAVGRRRAARRRGRARAGARAAAHPPEAVSPSFVSSEHLHSSGEYGEAGSSVSRSPARRRAPSACRRGGRRPRRAPRRRALPRRARRPAAGCRSSTVWTTAFARRVDPRERAGELVAHPDRRRSRPRSPFGPSPTGIVARTPFVAGSIRVTVPSRLFATQTAPAPTATASAPLPASIVCDDAPRCARRSCVTRPGRLARHPDRAVADGDPVGALADRDRPADGLPVRGSIRVTVPSLEFATQT